LNTSRPSRPLSGRADQYNNGFFIKQKRKTPAEIQLDLDRFLEYYNLSHQGYR
jgi:hypothetical protein